MVMKKDELCKERKQKLKKINRRWYHDWIENTPRMISIILLIGYALVFKGCTDYISTNRILCEVIDKVPKEGSKNTTSLYLILKEVENPKHRIFDSYSSPVDYSQCQIGKQYYMNLREMDIQQTPMKNLLFFIAPIILLLVGGVMFIGSFFIK